MITVKNLTKTYSTEKKTGNLLRDFFQPQFKKYSAVKNISFEIGEGELIGFIGPNGAGKTTTLKMLSGILHPTAGTIDILGFTPFEKNYTYLKQIGFVMGQKNQLLWDLPAHDSFRVNKEIYEISDADYKKTVGDLTELLDVNDFIGQPVRTLSLGQRMRLELIASLLHHPKILFLDEPTIGLDIFAQSIIRNFIKEYQERYKATIILTSHYMQDVQQLAKRVILINKGELIFDNTLEALVEKYSQVKNVTITVARKTKELPESIKRYDHTYNHPLLQIKGTKEELPDILAKLLPKLDYTDITVENEAIEDVIKKTFSR